MEKINHPSHYQSTNPFYETINVIEAWNLNFNLGNVIKYISRAGKKDDNSLIQDLEKAQWYLNREINKLKNNSNGISNDFIINWEKGEKDFEKNSVHKWNEYQIFN